MKSYDQPDHDMAAVDGMDFRIPMNLMLSLITTNETKSLVVWELMYVY